MTYREPPIDSVTRELCRARDIATARRVPMPVITAIEAALNECEKVWDRYAKRDPKWRTNRSKLK